MIHSFIFAAGGISRVELGVKLFGVGLGAGMQSSAVPWFTATPVFFFRLHSHQGCQLSVIYAHQREPTFSLASSCVLFLSSTPS